MANVFKCDICGKETYLYPPFTYKTKKEMIGDIEVDVPVTKKITRQNMQTGKVESVSVPDVEYQLPVTILVKLQVAGQEIQKDFCEKCVEEVMSDIKLLWYKLEKIEGK